MTLDELQGRLFANATEAAALLERDPRTVRKAAQNGEIPGAHKLGAKWMFPVQWLREQAGMPTAPPATSPNIDELADRVADRLFARFGLAFAVMVDGAD